MADGHRSKPTSWATVLVLIAGCIVLGFALPLQSVIVAILGGIVLLVGIVMAVAFRLMEDVH